MVIRSINSTGLIRSINSTGVTAIVDLTGVNKFKDNKKKLLIFAGTFQYNRNNTTKNNNNNDIIQVKSGITVSCVSLKVKNELDFLKCRGN